MRPFERNGRVAHENADAATDGEVGGVRIYGHPFQFGILSITFYFFSLHLSRFRLKGMSLNFASSLWGLVA